MSDDQHAAVGDARTARDTVPVRSVPAAKPDTKSPDRPRELGGPKGPEPTRYGDWEQNGRCTDF